MGCPTQKSEWSLKESWRRHDGFFVAQDNLPDVIVKRENEEHDLLTSERSAIRAVTARLRRLPVRELNPANLGITFERTLGTRLSLCPSELSGLPTLLRLVMHWFPQLLCLALLGYAQALSSSGNRVLVVTEQVSDKEKYSKFWGDLESINVFTLLFRRVSTEVSIIRPRP